MPGINILATEEVVIGHVFNWTACFISFGVIITVYVLMGVIRSIRFDDWKQLLVGIITGTILGVTFGPLFGFAANIPTDYETHYKVTISDEVSMNDFLDKYEIVDREGKIYTVREIQDGE